jgi:hypothetical protein
MVRLLLPLLVLIVVLSGCKSGQSAETAGRISLTELNSEMIQYSRWQNARSLALTNAIEASSDDDRLRYEATRMKLQIHNTQRKLMLAPDPRDVFTDSWVYAVQRRNYIDGDLGARAELFAPWRDEIVRNTDALIVELKRIGGLFMTPEELADAETAVEAYAAQHPTLGLFNAPTGRPSAEAKESGSSGGLGAIVNVPLAPFTAMQGVDAAAAGINRVADVAERMAVVTEDLPQQMRWQIEVLQFDVTHRDPLRTTFADLHRMTNSVEGVSRTVERLPEAVRAQVQDVMGSFDEPAQALQQTLREARAAADAMTATADSANTLVLSFQETFGTADPEPAPPRDPDEPSDLEQLTMAAEQLGDAVAEARGLVTELDGLLADSGAIDAQLRDLIRFATIQGILLVVAVLIAAILYRVLSSRVIRPR